MIKFFCKFNPQWFAFHSLIARLLMLVFLCHTAAPLFASRAATPQPEALLNRSASDSDVAPVANPHNVITPLRHINDMLAPQSGGIALTTLATSFSNAVGMDYYAPTSQLAVSVNYPTGQPRNLELIGTDGTHTALSNLAGLSSKLKIAAARDDGGGFSRGGFRAGELFTGTATAAVIARISADGSSVQNPWVSLPGESGIVNALYVDRTGVYGGDLIAVTAQGNVWRINASATATLVASLGVAADAVISVPNDASKYGLWAGKILAGIKSQSRINAISPQGVIESYQLTVSPTDLDLIPANENLFAVDSGAASLLGASANQFSAMAGDLLVTQNQPGALWRIHWTGTEFQATQIAQASQLESVAFAPAGVFPLGTTAGLAAVVRHAPSVNGRVEGAVRQLTGESVLFNSGAVITSDLLVPGTPQVVLNGTPNFGGTITGSGSAQPTGYQVTLNSGSTLGHLLTRVDPITLPTVATPPNATGTRDVTINTPGQSPGDFATLRDLTLNSNVGMVAVPPGTYRNFTANSGSGFVFGVAGSSTPSVYNLRSLTLNGTTQIQVVGPVVLTLALGSSLNGIIGTPSSALWLTFKVASGNLTLNSGSLLYGTVITPSSTVIINGNSTLTGSLQCDRLTVNSGGLLRGAADATAPVIAIDQPSEGAVIDAAQTVVSGTVYDQTTVTVTVNGVAATISGNTYTATVPLAMGANTLTATATDLYGNTASATRHVIRATNQAPTVNAGADQTISLPASATLSGSASDDGLPTGSTLTTTWSRISGPGNVTFTNPNQATTTASFSAAGTYTLRLTASDGSLSSSDDVVITVTPQNQAPQVNAGADQTVSFNLLQNPGNEQSLVNGEIPGWTEVTGTRWTQATAGSNGFPASFQGTTYFYPGAVAQAELSQDVNVSAFAAGIAAGTQLFVVKGYVRSFDESPADAGRIVIEYRDAANTNVLASFDSGAIQSPSQWTLVADTRLAPAGTGWIRVRLIGARNTGGNCDSYFDHLTLEAPTLAAALLSGTASDDGLPLGSTLATSWTKVSGPGTVTFTNLANPVSRALFDAPGIYVLRLNASDSQLTASDDVQVTVTAINQAPQVSAGPDQSIDLPTDTISLSGAATDDGLPAGGALTTTWSKVSGPGAVSFANAAQLATTATFDAPGIYVLRLSATDLDLSSSDDLVVSINQGPTVNAGADQTITLPSVATLNGTASDDGLPAGSTLAVTWSKVSGPGAVSFGNAAQAATTASFTAAGTYIVRLTATDGALTSSDDVTVTVNPTAINLQGAHLTLSPANVGPNLICTPQTLIATLVDNANAPIPGVNLQFSVNGANPTGGSAVTDSTGMASFTYTASQGGTDTVQAIASSAGTQAQSNPAIVTWTIFTRTIILTDNFDSENGGNGAFSFNAFTKWNVTRGSVDLFGHGFVDFLPQNGLYVDMDGTSGQAGRLESRNTFSLAPGNYLLKFDMMGPGVGDANTMTVSLGSSFSEVFSLPVNSPYLTVTRYITVATATNAKLVFDHAGGDFHGFVIDNIELTKLVRAGCYQTNQAPQVSAGPDQTITLPADVYLNGTVVDDGLPTGSSVSAIWSKASGPGTVTFSTPNSPTTMVTFSRPGIYTLRLTASDTELTSSDDVVLTITGTNQPPSVEAGQDQTIDLPTNQVTLNGTATDDDLPVGSTLSIAWSKVSGPGAVTFSNATGLATSASFTAAGVYVLRLTATDGALSTSDDVQVSVIAQNQPPQVNAGIDQTITLPASATLNGTASDDGLPAGSTLTLQWSKVSGPGSATFGNPAQATTTASFTAAGVYILRLTVTDGALSSSDDVQVTVNPAPINQAPQVNAGPDQIAEISANLVVNGSNEAALVNGEIPAWTEVTGATWTQATAGSNGFPSAQAGATYFYAGAAVTAELSQDVDVRAYPANAPFDFRAWLRSGSESPADTSQIILDYRNAANTQTIARLTFEANSDSSAWQQVTDLRTLPASTGYVRIRLIATRNSGTTNDGYFDAISLRAVGVAAARLQGTASDDGLPTGSSLSVQWSQVSGPGAVTFFNAAQAVTQVSFPGTGVYVLRLTATDGALSTSDDVQVSVYDAVTGPPPAVSISSPADGDEVTAPTNVVGSIDKGNWRLEYSLNRDSEATGQSWTLMASGSAPVSNATLAQLDPTLLLNGIYSLRLTSIDNSGQIGQATVAVIVSRALKVGLFTLSFNDLSVPVAGLPIQVVRTYDSRDKRQGDFGVGWTLSLNNIRLEKSVNLGRFWNETVDNGLFPRYCLNASRAHLVTVTFPDGKVYKFAAATSPQCQTIDAIRLATVSYVEQSGTTGTAGASLVAIGNNDVVVDGGIPGSVNLVGDSGLYNPRLFQLTTAEGLKYVIEEGVGLRSMTDLNGNTLTINSNGIIHSSGKSIVFTRDAQGRITQISDPAGNQMTYTYDANGDLVSFKDRENQTTSFTYNNAHGLLTITDPRGITPIRNDYDAAGRLLSHTDAFGHTITYTHDLAARHEIIKDRLGNETLYEYDGDGNVLRVTDALGHETSYTYDSRDNKLSETNALGKTTSYTYDADDNLTSVTDPLNHVTRYTYNSLRQALTVTDARNNVTTNTYTPTGQLETTTDALNHLTSYTYDAQGSPKRMTDAANQVTEYQCDLLGNLRQETDAAGHVTSYTYDANNNRISQTTTRTLANGSAETLVTSYAYDHLNRLVKTTYANGSFTQLSYNAIGQQATTTDQLGRVTSYSYDEMGRLQKTTYPDSTTEEATYDAEGRRLTSKDRAGRVTSFTYDVLGRLTKTTYADGTFTQTGYDAIGRVATTTDARGNVTTYEYDAANRRTKVIDALTHQTTFAYDTTGNQVTMTDANNHTTAYEYDALNRRTKVTYADSTFDQTGYDALGRVASKTDQAGKTTQYGYDSLGRLTSVTDALNQVTRYGYDELGEQITQTDALSRVTRYEYDKLGRRRKRTLPLGQVESYVYNAAGNLTSRTDFRGKTTQYGYDLMNRLLSKTPDASLNEAAVTFTYSATGRRLTMTDSSGTTSYTYDVRDRLLSKATPAGTLSYTYDSSGNLLTLSSNHTDGVNTSYGYDALNRLSTVTDNAPVSGARPATGVTTYSYDAAGNLAGYLYPNQVQTAYTYNALNRLTDVSATKASTTLASYAYTLGAAGNRVSVTEQSGRSISYGYDALYRLVSETISNDPVSAGNGSIGYSYDAVGNRLTRTSTLAAVPATTSSVDANDRLASDSYDNNGNTVSSNSNTYQYDSENRLVTLNAGTAGEVRYVYDGDGNRVAKTAGTGAAAVTTTYLVDTQNPTGYAQVVEEVVSGSVQRVYVLGLMRMSQQQQVSGNWQTSFYGYDGHGSVRQLTDSNGAVTDSYTYDAFGNLIARTGATANDYLYAGEQVDAALGMYYLRARYMNPASGRFWTMDSFEGVTNEPSSLHKYLYAAANPVNKTDPSGYSETLAGQLQTLDLSIRIDSQNALIGLRVLAAFGVDYLTRNHLYLFHFTDATIVKIAEMYNNGSLRTAKSAKPMYFATTSTHLVSLIMYGIGYPLLIYAGSFEYSTMAGIRSFAEELGVPYNTLPDDLKKPSNKPVLILTGKKGSLTGITMFNGGIEAEGTFYAPFIYSTFTAAPGEMVRAENYKAYPLP
jgi:RHS repeat-associated protein